MATITATEFKQNLGYYFKLAEKEDIFITKNGKTNFKIVNINQKKPSISRFFGTLPKSTYSAKDARRDLALRKRT